MFAPQVLHNVKPFELGHLDLAARRLGQVDISLLFPLSEVLVDEVGAWPTGPSTHLQEPLEHLLVHSVGVS